MSESDNLLELAKGEMRDRLTNEARRKSMPDYTLARVIGILEKATNPIGEEAEPEERDFLDIVSESGLPTDKKREMLAQELERLYDRQQRILEALEVMNASQIEEAAEVPLHEVR